jgi:hypothetical protein
MRRAVAVGLLSVLVALSLPAAGVLGPAAAYAQTVDPACTWEQGGVPEDTPAPCPTPLSVDQTASGSDFSHMLEVGLGVLVFLTAVATVFAWSRRS